MKFPETIQRSLSMKKTALVLCAVILLSTLLFACSSGSNDNSTTAAGDGTAAVTTVMPTGTTDKYDVADSLQPADYGGYNFRMSTYTSPDADGTTTDNGKYFYSEGATGETINDAIFKANTTVAERFNVKLSTVEMGTDDNSHETAITNSIKAGSDDFDLAMGHDGLSGTASLKGYFVDLLKVPNLDFTKPWWPQNTISSLTIDNQMYLFSNCISYLGMNSTRVLFVNKAKMQDYGLTVPYQDVTDGAWTLDKLISMTKDIYTDVNGDGKRDVSDFYGFAYTGPSYCWQEPFDCLAITKAADGTMSIGISNDRTVQMVNSVYDLLFNSQGGYFTNSGTNPYGVKNDMFSKGNALFIYTELGEAIDLFRTTDVNYGILPMPKLDSNQSQYYAGYTDKLFMIPTTNTDLSRTGTIVEAMSAEGYRTVFPQYYDQALKNKYLQDQQSAGMLDLINSCRILDFAYIYGFTFSWTLTDLFASGKPSTDFASFYAKNLSADQKKLDSLIASFDALANS